MKNTKILVLVLMIASVFSLFACNGNSAEDEKTGIVIFSPEVTVNVVKPVEGDYSDLGVLSEKTVILCSDTSAKIQILK